jgi:hypothetical protein
MSLSSNPASPGALPLFPIPSSFRDRRDMIHARNLRQVADAAGELLGPINFMVRAAEASGGSDDATIGASAIRIWDRLARAISSTSLGLFGIDGHELPEADYPASGAGPIDVIPVSDPGSRGNIWDRFARAQKAMADAIDALAEAEPTLEEKGTPTAELAAFRVRTAMKDLRAARAAMAADLSTIAEGFRALARLRDAGDTCAEVVREEQSGGADAIARTWSDANAELARVWRRITALPTDVPGADVGMIADKSTVNKSASIPTGTTMQALVQECRDRVAIALCCGEHAGGILREEDSPNTNHAADGLALSLRQCYESVERLASHVTA